MKPANLAAGLLVQSVLWCALTAHAAPSATLWQIGKADGTNGEFALSPRDFAKHREDGFFIVGRSAAERDWSYAHPGPADTWAGSRPHTFRVLFGLKNAPRDGQCGLTLAFVDTHSIHPPTLRIEINGQAFEKQTTKGGGDASVNGEPSAGKASRCEVAFPASILKPGENEIGITTVRGSWVLYDAITLDAPAGVELSPVTPRTMLGQARALPVVLRQGDGGAQAVKVSLRHIGDEMDAVLRVGTADVAKVRLRGGVQELEAGIPPVESPTPRKLAIVAGDKVIAEAEFTQRPPSMKEIWLLPHSHVDIGYTHLQAEVVDVQIGNLEKAMELVKSSAANPPGMRFKWNPEAIWTIDHYLRRATPEKREAFLRAVKERQVGLDGLYANMLTGLCRPEELVRVVSDAPRLSKLAGVDVDSSAICDVPGYTWGLISVMRQAGIRYFAIGPNLTDRVGSVHAAWDQKPFYWVSPSGQERVLCWIVDHYWAHGDLEQHAMAYLDAQDKRAFPYDLGYVYWTGKWGNGGVDNAPPDEQAAQKVAEWNRRYLSPKIVMSTASEFFHAFEERHGGKVPSFKGDMTPYWEDGAGSTARETGMNRLSADRLVQAEALWAMLAPVKRPAAQFDAAWRNVMLYSEHTWGAYNSISEPDKPFVLDQWKVKGGFAVDADGLSRKLLADAVAQRGATQAAAFDVFNTTQWERTDLVVLTKQQSAAGDIVTDAQGNAMPSQRLRSGELAFLAKDVPAFGAKRFAISAGTARPAGAATAAGTTLSTSRLSVAVDKTTGAIQSLRLVGLDTDFVDPKSPFALNDFRYTLGTDNKGQANSPVTLSVVDAGPLVATLRIESAAPGCNNLVREVRVIDGLDRVELANHVDRKAVRQKDAVHFGFGFNVPGGTVRMETPFAVVRPNVDQLLGSCRNWFTVQRWVDVSNDRFGITWAPIEAPLMQIGGITANLLGAVNLHEWMTQAPNSQTIVSWAMNNHWHTNYKADQPGLTSFRYILRPHGAASTADAARFGVESTRPLIVAEAAGDAPKAGPGLSISSPSVLVETLKVSEDGQAMIVRLFGVGGRDEDVILRLRDARPGEIWLSDLGEAPRQKLDGPIHVPAYGVVTVRIPMR